MAVCSEEEYEGKVKVESNVGVGLLPEFSCAESFGGWKSCCNANSVTNAPVIRNALKKGDAILELLAGLKRFDGLKMGGRVCVFPA